MEQPKSGSGVLPEREQQPQSTDRPKAPPAGTTHLVIDGNAKPPASRVVAPSRRRRTIWLAGLATTAVLVLGTVASLGGSDAEQGDGSPRAWSNAAEGPIGSDRHLENLDARMRADGGAVGGSDRHLENQARRAGAAAAHGRVLHRENS